MSELTIRKLEHAEMRAAAIVHRASYDERLPWLAGRHTPEEDESYFRDQLFHTSQIWGAVQADTLIGIIAFRADWIDQLYVRPQAQGKGAGSRLLRVAKAAYPRLHLWTFQRNTRARRFYENRGFVLVKETDGAENQEKEADALYLWSRADQYE